MNVDIRNLPFELNLAAYVIVADTLPPNVFIDAPRTVVPMFMTSYHAPNDSDVPIPRRDLIVFNSIFSLRKYNSHLAEMTILTRVKKLRCADNSTLIRLKFFRKSEF
jgi:hypothetical protein